MDKFAPVIEIRRVREHYEGYIDGKFVVSGDTYNEVAKDLEEMEEEYGN